MDPADLSPPTARRRGLTLRSLLVGSALSVLCGLYIPFMDHYQQGTFVGGQHLSPGAVFALMVLVLLVNPLLRLLSPRLPFSRAELLLIYGMLLIATLLPGHGSESVFVPVSASAFYYDTPASGWEKLFFGYVPDWLHPARGLPITGMYESLSPGMQIPWGAWLAPLLAWGFLTLVLYLLATFASVLLYPQWSNYEKLTFPLVALPMEMTQNPGQPFAARSFWGNGWMWLGFAAAVAVETSSGLKFYYPAFSGLKLDWPLSEYLKDTVFRNIGWTPAIVYPAVIGITVLLRTEVSFSVVLFTWLSRAQRVISYWFGIRNTSGRDIAGHALWLGGQPWGGYFAYFAMTLYLGRRQLAKAWRELLGQERSTGGDSLSYPTCLVGLVLCLAVATWWLVLAGMSLWTALFVLVVYVAILVILSKVIAEVGLLFVQQTMTPAQALNYYFGTSAPGARSLTIGMYFDRAFGTDLRATPMPNIVQGLRLADEGHFSSRQLLTGVWVAILVALPLALVSQLGVYYRYGAASCDQWFVHWSGVTGWQVLGSWIASPQPPNLTLWIATAVGAGVVVGTSALRQRYLWFWPHPVGFIMMHTHPVNMTWFSIFLGGLFKAIILKYGGYQGMKRSTPFFLGLALGDIFMMAFWRLVAFFTGAHRHFLLPG